MKLALLLAVAAALPSTVSAGGQQYNVRLVIKGPEILRCIRHDQVLYAPAATQPAPRARAAAITDSPEFFDGRLWAADQIPSFVSWGSFQCRVNLSRQAAGAVEVDLDMAGVSGQGTKGQARLQIGEAKTFSVGSYVVSAEVRRSRPLIVPASFHRIFDQIAAGQPLR